MERWARGRERTQLHGPRRLCVQQEPHVRLSGQARQPDGADQARRGLDARIRRRGLVRGSLGPGHQFTATTGDATADLAWANPTTAYDIVQIVRKAGSQPTGPSDGTIVFQGNSTTFRDYGVVNGTVYEYAVWTMHNGRFSTPARVTVTPNSGPPSPVTAARADPGDGTVTLSWTNPSAAFNSIKVVRKAGTPPTGITDGTSSTTASARPPSTRASRTTRSTTTPSGSSGTACSLRRCGRTRRRLSASRSSQRSGCVAGRPPGRPDLAESEDTVRRDRHRPAGGDAADLPTDGTQVYAGGGTSLADTSVANGTTYYYSAWARLGTRYSAISRATATPVAPPLVPVVGLTASAGSGRVDLSWTNPTIRFDRVIVVRKLGGPPSDPSDGTTLVSGVATSYSDTNITIGTTYYYGVWVDREDELSAPARVKATPLNQASEIAYTAQPQGTYNQTDGGFTVGTVFHVTEDKVVLKLGRVYKAGTSGPHQIGIWDDATRQLVTSVTVTATSPVATLDPPVVLTAGRRYVLGIQQRVGTPWSPHVRSQACLRRSCSTTRPSSTVRPSHSRAAATTSRVSRTRTG